MSGFVQCGERTRTSSASSFRADSTYEEGNLALFEPRVIAFHVAERHAGLLPGDVNTQVHAITWMFAALDTVEQPILNHQTIRLLDDDKTWYE